MSDNTSQVKCGNPDGSFPNPEYYRLHAVCPNCGGEHDMEQTTMGPGLDVDNNTCLCGCGLRGIVHELIEDRRSQDV